MGLWFFYIWKNINLIHMLDPIQYEFIFLFTTLADQVPEPKLWYSGSGEKFWLLPAPAPQHYSWHFLRNRSLILIFRKKWKSYDIVPLNTVQGFKKS